MEKINLTNLILFSSEGKNREILKKKKRIGKFGISEQCHYKRFGEFI